jgi:hypothetical protein
MAPLHDPFDYHVTWETVATIYMGVTRVPNKSGAVKEPSINLSLGLLPQIHACFHMSTVLIPSSPPL